MALDERQGHYTGSNTLWLGDDAPPETSSATADVRGSELAYTWSFRGTAHRGVITLGDGGLHWVDSFHQSTGVELWSVPAHGALAAGWYAYPAGDGSPDWSWRLAVCGRPDGTLVVQMTNITPWGEEAPAVRLVLSRA